MASRDLLLKGMRWRVGSGLEISVRSDPLLPTSYPFPPTHDSSAELSNWISFLLLGVGINKRCMLASFEATDAEIILAMPLSEHSSY